VDIKNLSFITTSVPAQSLCLLCRLRIHDSFVVWLYIVLTSLTFRMGAVWATLVTDWLAGWKHGLRSRLRTYYLLVWQFSNQFPTFSSVWDFGNETEAKKNLLVSWLIGNFQTKVKLKPQGRYLCSAFSVSIVGTIYLLKSSFVYYTLASFIHHWICSPQFSLKSVVLVASVNLMKLERQAKDTYITDYGCYVYKLQLAFTVDCWKVRCCLPGTRPVFFSVLFYFEHTYSLLFIIHLSKGYTSTDHLINIAVEMSGVAS